MGGGCSGADPLLSRILCYLCTSIEVVMPLPKPYEYLPAKGQKLGVSRDSLGEPFKMTEWETPVNSRRTGKW